MPGMDGETLGRRIKASPLLRETVLVMMTSMDRPGDAARLKEIGFAAYLSKPIRKGLLLDCLRRAYSPAGGPAEGPACLPPSPQPPEGPIPRKARILLAEDNEINQAVALKILEKFGYRADVARNGKEAVQALEREAYDLVLMDVQMPEMDGYEATAVIRDPASAVLDHGIPVIAMTAHAMEGDREKCLEAGMDDYIAKPVNPKAVAEVIERWLAERREGADPEEAAPPLMRKEKSPDKTRKGPEETSAAERPVHAGDERCTEAGRKTGTGTAEDPVHRPHAGAGL